MPIKVCIVSENAYPILDPSDAASFGGAETRAVTFARGLREAGCEVVLVVDSHVPFRRRSIDGMAIVNLRSPLRGVRASFYGRVGKLTRFPWLRVRQWHPVLLAQLPVMAFALLGKRLARVGTIGDLRPIGADVYMTFGVHRTSARVVYTAKQVNARSIVFVASNADLDTRYLDGSRHVSAYGDRATVCRYTVTNADNVILQTEMQQRLLAERFQRHGVTIENPFDMPWWMQRLAEEPPAAMPEPGFVLWVGRADRFHKRPQLALQIARACPHFRFVMIVDPRDPDVERAIAENLPANVDLRGKAAYAHMPHYFKSALIYLNTGSTEQEGFPNVLLQAAASETPIVSLDVGAEFLNRAGCGVWAAGSVERAVAAINALAGDPKARRQHGSRGRRYVLEHHGVEEKVRQLMATLEHAPRAQSPTRITDRRDDAQGEWRPSDVTQDGISMPHRLWQWIYSRAIHPAGSEARFRLATFGDPHKRRTLRLVAPYTMVGLRRLVNAWDLVKRADSARVPGAIVECGVFNGGSSGVMAAASSQRRIWLFDSFEGLPEPTTFDGAAARVFAHGRDGGALRPIERCVGSLESVHEVFFDVLHIGPDRVEIRKGWFQETLPQARRDIGPIAVLRLDADWYESTRVCLDQLHDLVVPGGYVIIDDYGYWEGCRRAVDEFLSLQRPVPRRVRVDDSAIWWQVPRPDASGSAAAH